LPSLHTQSETSSKSNLSYDEYLIRWKHYRQCTVKTSEM